ncbi:hypothetical protein NE237_022109 [Protea cynaroides]|uniref:Protein PHLOEM PROTEIN 2-LIKE A10 n=1 Tax=Protea cynaroides TaxID=273540 RepID=A0A9Q0HCJ4_9MAGN|nr:hypothetical protein NE237_022109 [Protea cynaroides]
MELQLVQKGLAFSRRRKKLILLLAGLGITGYGACKVYHLPSVVKKRKRFIKLLGALISVAEAVSDSAETISVVSKDVKEFLQSNSDQIPTSLKQISKITTSEEFSESLIRVTQALTVGILRGYRSDTRNGEEALATSDLTDRIMNRLLSTAGSGFASVVVGSFARSLVLAFYSDGQSSGGSNRNNHQIIASSLDPDSSSIPRWVNVVCSDKCRELITDCVQLFVSTAVAVFLDKTMDINTYDEIFSGLTNPKHERKVRDILISLCNGAVETLVKTSHQVLTNPNSNSSLNPSSLAVGQAEGTNTARDEVSKEALAMELKERSSVDGIRDSVWVGNLSSTLAVPGNRRFVLDLTGRVTFETVRFFLDFLLYKLLAGLKKSYNIVHEEVAERGMEVVRYIGAKSSVIITLCLSLCLHMVGGPRFLVPA